MKFLLSMLVLCSGCVANRTLTWNGTPPFNVYVNNQIVATVTNPTYQLPLQTGDEVFVETIGVEGKSNTVIVQ